ncbi:MAG: hypothetical protein ACI9G1_003055, partial [Pirellulaceae bacterium]
LSEINKLARVRQTHCQFPFIRSDPIGASP